ncbi:5-formyltetrahydrofolate cyclo-ligase [Aneurinibacillus sp. Ricciae_BoGa-3]|uniref:5-formyltetrahydrofolate cyclo-ligase n=1 Tax=Aneurinibacillus sp. Ricciae_BoGa-3 TaxID=3022697 RepID=UPI0023424880|nr:5-formyltetrahydrofolate cyclo-ligase [Aneurinibacillus sp. Ricciae_BoGa-3]WCK55004.1 5-formyltetrahydrofolate cyclo-ligase [Aneurinibacillus sp. Ricciae_BoGa-3]
MDTKQQIRTRIIEEREALTADERASRSEAIVDTLLSLKQVTCAGSVFVFLPFNGEVDIDRFISTCAEAGKKIYVPKTYINEKRMRLFRFTGWDRLIPGPYGIREPDPAHAEMWQGEPIDVMIVPGVAFTRNGERLGYGGGFYDRFLEGLKDLPDRIAPCFEMQIVGRLPVETHDIVVNHLVTEKTVYNCSKFRHGI